MVERVRVFSFEIRILREDILTSCYKEGIDLFYLIFLNQGQEWEENMLWSHIKRIFLTIRAV